MSFNQTPLKFRAGNVQFPTYVLAFVTVANPDPRATQDLDADLETYSGFIELDAKEASGNTQRYTCQSFIPTDDHPTLKTYSTPPLVFQKAVNVSLAATSPNGAHVAINAIDAAQVRLVTQFDKEQVLLLEFDIGIRNTELIRVAYTVTVASVFHPGTEQKLIQISPDDTPKD